MDNTSGRRWARFFLALALLVSVVGNVAHTVLADSTISLWLRVPGAVIWPVFTFGAIEIIVRMIWERSWTHNIARNILLLPAIPAAITSYEHLWALLKLMGETAFIAEIGPLAIDGMMVGCTMVLLFTRPAPAIEAPDLDAVIDRYFPNGWDAVTEVAPISAVPVSVAPISASPETVSKPRVSRGEIAPALKAAVSALISGETPEIGDGASRAVIGRYGKVLRTLRDNPNAEIDTVAEKVKPELVDMIRGAMREVAVR